MTCCFFFFFFWETAACSRRRFFFFLRQRRTRSNDPEVESRRIDTVTNRSVVTLVDSHLSNPLNVFSRRLAYCLLPVVVELWRYTTMMVALKRQRP
ncbi:hypothetical protein BZA77DRAFT_8436 [Pyronema omphalodes]|nr:hypothetical protein BZA77DRAFT_8436 [Pyronema omphalodes]